MSDAKENRPPAMTRPDSEPDPFELRHRSALTVSHAQSHIARLELELRDAMREAQVSRASEIVYKDQLALTQTQLSAQSQRALQLQRDNSDLQLRLQHASDQGALSVEHAKEQGLLADLSDKQWRSRYAAKEKQMLDELAARQREIDELKRSAAAQLRSEVDSLRTHASHDTVIALHEQKMRFEEAAAEAERSWRQRCEQLEAQLRAIEAASVDEMRQQHSAAQTERSNLIQSHQSQLVAMQRDHQSSMDEAQRHSAAELSDMQQRIHHLIAAQQQAEAEKSRLMEQQAAQQQSTSADHDQRVQHLESQAQSLTAHAALLQSQLEAADANLRESQDHHGHLTAQYNDLLTQYQNIASQAQYSASAVEILTAERDACKAKYVALGSRVEHLLASDESSLASTLDNERRKRDALKSAYAAERAKWKAEKHTLCNALSDQEKELGELRSLTRECQSKLDDAHKSLQELRAVQSAERHASELHIAQLQQDVHAMQAQRKISDDELRDKNHQIEKLLVEKTHVEDYQIGATHQLNQGKDLSIAQLEHEFALKSKQHEFDMAALRKEHAMEIHTLRMDSESAKAEAWTQAQLQMDHKVDTMRSELYSAEQMDSMVKLRTDERVAALAKSLVPPHQHESIVASKLESQRARLTIEFQLAMQTSEANHQAAVAAMEAKHQMRVDELQGKYTSEWQQHVDSLQRRIAELEEQRSQERSSREQLESSRAQLSFDLSSLESAHRSALSSVETHQANESRFLSHIAGQTAAIDKLKTMLASEKKRVQDMPHEERSKLQAQVEEERARAQADREQLKHQHAQAMADLQAMRETDQRLLHEANTQRESREAHHRLIVEQWEQRLASELSQSAATHKSLWVSREQSWLSEQHQREALIEAKIATWEEQYKNELALRERKLTQCAEEVASLSSATQRLREAEHAIDGQAKENERLKVKCDQQRQRLLVVRSLQPSLVRAVCDQRNSLHALRVSALSDLSALLNASVSSLQAAERVAHDKMTAQSRRHTAESAATENQWRARVAEKDAQLQQLDADLSVARAEATALARARDAVTSSHAALQHHLSQLQAQFSRDRVEWQQASLSLEKRLLEAEAAFARDKSSWSEAKERDITRIRDEQHRSHLQQEAQAQQQQLQQQSSMHQMESKLLQQASQLDQLRAAHTALQSSYADCRQSLSVCEERESHLRSEVESYRSDLAVHRADESKRRLAEVSGLVRQLRDQLLASEEQHHSDQQKASQDLDHLRRQLHDKQQSLQSLQHRFDTLASELQSQHALTKSDWMAEQLREQEHKRQHMQAEAAHHAARLEATHADAIASYKAKEAELQLAMRGQQSALQAAHVDLASRSAELSHLQSESDRWIRDNGQLRSALAALQSKVDQVAASSLEAQHRHAREHAAEMQQAQDKARRKLQAVQQSASHKDTELQAHANRMAQLELQLAELPPLRSQCDSLDAALSASSRSLRSAFRCIHGLLAFLTTKQRELHAVVGVISDAVELPPEVQAGLIDQASLAHVQADAEQILSDDHNGSSPLAASALVSVSPSSPAAVSPASPSPAALLFLDALRLFQSAVHLTRANSEQRLQQAAAMVEAMQRQLAAAEHRLEQQQTELLGKDDRIAEMQAEHASSLLGSSLRDLSASDPYRVECDSLRARLLEQQAQHERDLLARDQETRRLLQSKEDEMRAMEEATRHDWTMQQHADRRSQPANRSISSSLAQSLRSTTLSPVQRAHDAAASLLPAAAMDLSLDSSAGRIPTSARPQQTADDAPTAEGPSSSRQQAAVDEFSSAEAMQAHAAEELDGQRWRLRDIKQRMRRAMDAADSSHEHADSNNSSSAERETDK